MSPLSTCPALLEAFFGLSCSWVCSWICPRQAARGRPGESIGHDVRRLVPTETRQRFLGQRRRPRSSHIAQFARADAAQGQDCRDAGEIVPKLPGHPGHLQQRQPNFRFLVNLLYIYLELYSEQATGLTPREAAEEVVHDARGGLGRKAQDDADREAGDDAARRRSVHTALAR